jgi:hypothetical protein
MRKLPVASLAGTLRSAALCFLVQLFPAVLRFPSPVNACFWTETKTVSSENHRGDRVNHPETKWIPTSPSLCAFCPDAHAAETLSQFPDGFGAA